VKDNPQFIADLVRATQDAWNKYQQNPAAVNAVASKVSGIPAAQLAVVGQVLDLLNMSSTERQVTQADVNTWTKLFPILQQAGFIQQAPTDVQSMFIVTSQLGHSK